VRCSRGGALLPCDRLGFATSGLSGVERHHPTVGLDLSVGVPRRPSNRAAVSRSRAAEHPAKYRIAISGRRGVDVSRIRSRGPKPARNRHKTLVAYEAAFDEPTSTGKVGGVLRHASATQEAETTSPATRIRSRDAMGAKGSDPAVRPAVTAPSSTLHHALRPAARSGWPSRSLTHPILLISTRLGSGHDPTRKPYRRIGHPSLIQTVTISDCGHSRGDPGDRQQWNQPPRRLPPPSAPLPHPCPNAVEPMAAI
jgi:hypothetical protein